MSEPKSYIDLIGRQFGELTIFKKGATNTKGCARFWARCSCGGEAEYLSKSLRDGIWDRCRECKKIEFKNKEKIRIQDEKELALKKTKEDYDISGRVFGSITVLNPVLENKYSGVYFCSCFCGFSFSASRSSLISPKFSGKCKKCVSEDRVKLLEEKRSVKIEEALKVGLADCQKCGQDYSIDFFNKVNFRKGVFICLNCNREYLKSKSEEWVSGNLKKEFFECPRCSDTFFLKDVPQSRLKLKDPLCNNCSKAYTKKLFQKYEESNLLKNSIECSKCGLEKDLKDFHPSYLKFSKPVCKKCSREYKKGYEKRRGEADPVYKEKRNIGRKISDSLKDRGWEKKGSAPTYLGVSKEGFVKHIESLFREGMSWENRSEWEIDHVIPISLANTIEEVKTLWHYKNLQPLWCWENLLKSNRTDWRNDEWAKELVDLRMRLGLDK